jgi:hypothetical protein
MFFTNQTGLLARLGQWHGNDNFEINTTGNMVISCQSDNAVVLWTNTVKIGKGLGGNIHLNGEIQTQAFTDADHNKLNALISQETQISTNTSDIATLQNSIGATPTPNMSYKQIHLNMVDIIGLTSLPNSTYIENIYHYNIGQMLRNNGFGNDFYSDGRWNNNYHYEFQFNVKFTSRNSTIFNCKSGLRNLRADISLSSNNTVSVIEANPGLNDEHNSTSNYLDSGMQAESGNTNIEVYRYSSTSFMIQGDYSMNENYIPYLKTNLKLNTSSSQIKNLECTLLVKRYLQ